MSAVRISSRSSLKSSFLPTPRFSASELLERFSSRMQKPVVVFDAPDPELIALRLLTALWPDIRRFALSTFALSPRKLEVAILTLSSRP